MTLLEMTSVAAARLLRQSALVILSCSRHLSCRVSVLELIGVSQRLSTRPPNLAHLIHRLTYS